MKKILVLLFIAMSIISFSQESRIEKELKESDSLFNIDYHFVMCEFDKLKNLQDSLKLNQIFELIDYRNELITIKEKQLYDMYFLGYLNSWMECRNGFNLDELYKGIIANIKAYNQLKYIK